MTEIYHLLVDTLIKNDVSDDTKDSFILNLASMNFPSFSKKVLS